MRSFPTVFVINSEPSFMLDLGSDDAACSEAATLA